MLLYAALAFVVLIAIILAIAATRPAIFIVERSIFIAAPPEKIEPLITDFHHWTSWSPWEHLDPAMQKTYSGSPSGEGAIYAWSGNAKAGAGRMEILTATPAKTGIQLDFIKPFANRMKADFTYTPQPGGTQVLWRMSGPQKFFPSKVMSVFFSMDKMIGGDFERGLAALKSLAEAGPQPL